MRQFDRDVADRVERAALREDRLHRIGVAQVAHRHLAGGLVRGIDQPVEVHVAVPSSLETALEQPAEKAGRPRHEDLHVPANLGHFHC